MRCEADRLPGAVRDMIPNDVGRLGRPEEIAALGITCAIKSASKAMCGRGGCPSLNRRFEELMTTRSRIEWTEHTWNPVTGCTNVSPGCNQTTGRCLSPVPPNNQMKPQPRAISAN
jgi:hypothetical protein